MPTIAVLSTSPALTSILGATLRRSHEWRVREFRDPRSLGAYMRIAPLAMMVADYTLGDTTLADVVTGLRKDGLTISRDAQIIALSRTVNGAMRNQCLRAGIDEVMAKPMSPLYLEERVRARLATGPVDYVTQSEGYFGPERRGRIPSENRVVPFERRGNVVSFGQHKGSHDGEPPVSPA